MLLAICLGRQAFDRDAGGNPIRLGALWPAAVDRGDRLAELSQDRRFETRFARHAVETLRSDALSFGRSEIGSRL
jgi:hypothetical protein